MGQPIEEHDGEKRYCPMLGHEVPFAYCREPGADLPCRRILDCWGGIFDIEQFIREHFDESEIGRIFTPRQDKMATLVELIERARKGNRPSG